MAEPVRVRRLTDDERRRLLLAYRPRWRDREKARRIRQSRISIILHSASGMSPSEVARRVAVDEGTVRRVIRAFDERGPAALGLPPEVDPSTGWRWGQRNLISWLVKLLAVATAVIALRHGLWDTLVNWSRGEVSERQAALWGVSILWWGRIGKGIQFVAGFVALLDIYGPKRLAQLGKRSARRARAAVKMIRFAPIGRRAHRREAYFRTALQHDVSHAARDDPAPGKDDMVLGGFEHSLADLNGYQEALAKLYDEYDGKSRCDQCIEPPVALTASARGPRRMWLWECEHGRFTFDTCVDDLVRRNFSDEERAARRSLDNFNFRPFLFLLIFLPLTMGPIVLLGPLGYRDIGGVVGLILGLVIVMSDVLSSFGDGEGRSALGRGFARVVAALSPMALSLRFIAVLCRVASVVLKPVVWVMDRPTPGHPLRKWAFSLFIIGFFFDVLAS